MNLVTKVLQSGTSKVSYVAPLKKLLVSGYIEILTAKKLL